jgi:formiminotetrahydrofolate cyclodeaminase
MEASWTLEHYLDRLASRDAAPGGGAAVALTGAQAAALLAMVDRLSDGDDERLAKADAARRQLLALAKKDGAAFEAVMAAYKLPNGGPDEKKKRNEAVQSALKGATEVPLEVMGVLEGLFEIADAVVDEAKATVASDAGIAAELLGAAMKAARFNVLVNLKYLKDEDYADDATHRMNGFVDGKKERRKTLVKQVRKVLEG